ncbi:hypothetical protein NDU88_005129 [Pleurodeles waltl]|uniref:Uncharacterized protein n=1 Tax=Pleurodeles waltl TaxID=8319 RepID=A0AAV7RHM6_PLEWA|nr:hypothetical protein NDU88_005129 [Pleurodeles waltl]
MLHGSGTVRGLGAVFGRSVDSGRIDDEVIFSGRRFRAWNRVQLGTRKQELRMGLVMLVATTIYPLQLFESPEMPKAGSRERELLAKLALQVPVEGCGPHLPFLLVRDRFPNFTCLATRWRPASPCCFAASPKCLGVVRGRGEWCEQHLQIFTAASYTALT